MGLTKPQERHRASALKQSNKVHKHGRHKSKGVIDNETKGKVSVKSLTKRNKKNLGKDERRHQAGQLRKKKREEVLLKKRALGGSKTAPFLVAVVALSPEISTAEVLEMLQRADPDAIVTNSPNKVVHISVPRFKQRFSFLEVAPGDVYATLDALKVADTVLFLETARHWEEGLYPEAELLLTTTMAQGLPTSVVAVMDLETVPKKKQQDAKISIQKEIGQYLPEEKVSTLSSDSDSLLLLRRIGSQKQKSLIQRDRRPHLMVEEIQALPETEGTEFVNLRVSGYLRGQNLSANQLVHIPGWGNFQIQQIETPSLDPHPLDVRKRSDDGMEEDNKVLEVADPMKQESLESENIPDPMDAEQTWPTEEEIAEAEAERKTRKIIKKVPKGFSDYQAAWIPDCDAEEVSGDDEESDYDDEMEDPELDAMSVADSNQSENDEDEEEFDTVTVTEGAPDAERYDAEMDMHEELETLKKLKDAKTDAQFPDEIDTPHDMPARVRFQKYRGLQSFRTSPWDPKENLPSDYARIFQFENFDRTRKRVLDQLKDNCSGAMPGWYITLVITNAPREMLENQKPGVPLVLFGLLPHEQKMSVLNLVLKRPAQMSFGLQTPIKSKEQLVFQCGFRRFKANPVFSQHTNGSKHKFERYFQPDAVVVATVFAPITFPPASVLAFIERKDGTQQLVATGSLLSVNPDRIVAKRVVLSGHPFKVNKRSAVIRFMFFNREDITWFKPVELRTKFGRRGHIKEPLGTHGHMKCVFDGQLKSQDTVMLHLYKRVFPKWTYDPYVTAPDPLFKAALRPIEEEDEEMS
ncbi:Pre-rRNA-processing protein TSR1-like protein [Frankliniella fusca]|uniref:Pre-rRNA-processing protein TSR1 homolog n=1 Tax=Frankliniella fusca TaxID=407009 RepID=A0AAE1H824_9NEOP|nr:Pre-rRNA-processing protein TSR1-like protein [Frankliniella fusca]